MKRERGLDLGNELVTFSPLDLHFRKMKLVLRFLKRTLFEREKERKEEK